VLRARLARYEALVEYAPDAIVILDVDTGRFETVNAAAEELFGLSRAQLLQVGPAEISPPAQPDGRPSAPAAREYVDRALTGEQPRFDWVHRRADGVDVPCEVRLLRLPDPGRRLVRGSVVDVTDRRRDEDERLVARQQQLHALTVALAAAGTAAEAGAALTASLHETLGAAVVAVCTLGEDGQLHTVDVHGNSPAWATRFASIPLSARVPLADAARTRRPVWLSDRRALLDGYPGLAAHLHPRTEATASLPLVVGDRLVGALAVVFRRPRPFDGAERSFLLTVAGQVAAALERAALADVRREMAETLQRSLLPTRLPDTGRLAVSTRYLPAVTGTAAGGDWYDVLAVDEHCVALVVGDVVGHGAAAAAVMGRLSSALSGLLLAGHSPARALDLLDRFAERIEGAELATVASLVLDPATGRLTYSSAGHPPPLMVTDDGTVTYLDGGHGPALGVPGRGRRPEAVTSVPTGSTLLLYTDGLVERRDAVLDDGLDRLAAAAAARTSASLTALVDEVLVDVLGRHGADDDVAVLAVRLMPEPASPEGTTARIPRSRPPAGTGRDGTRTSRTAEQHR
jgi:PAS domain S-box-containing protein